LEKLNQAGLLWLVAIKLEGLLEMPRLPMLERGIVGLL
jgi:hypothetical protein